MLSPRGRDLTSLGHCFDPSTRCQNLHNLHIHSRQPIPRPWAAGALHVWGSGVVPNHLYNLQCARNLYLSPNCHEVVDSKWPQSMPPFRLADSFLGFCGNQCPGVSHCRKPWLVHLPLPWQGSQDLAFSAFRKKNVYKCR